MAKKTGVKKGVRKTSTSSKASTLRGAHSSTEKILIENFVALQKVMTSLSSRFDDLSKQISKLLDLFALSAKTLTSKEFPTGSGENKELMKKIDEILDQNKTIARGLALMYEGNMNSGPRQQSDVSQPPQQMPSQGMSNVREGNYQKSIFNNRGQ